MSDNFTQASTEIKCTCPEAADSLMHLLEVNSTDDVQYVPCCAFERTNEYTVWIYSMDYLDSNVLYEILERWVKNFPNESGYISYAYSSSKPRIDEFGGAVIAFARGKVKFFDPVMYAEEWIEDK